MTSDPRPVLIACSHGTDDAEGRRVVRGIVDGIIAARPGLDVREAFVDVQEPALPTVVDALPAGRRAVIVPLLLSAGFHTGVDIVEATRLRPGDVVAATPLGPDCRLSAIVTERMRGAGVRAGDAVVLAAAGSSRPEAAAAVTTVANGVRARWPGRLAVGYGAGAQPRVPAAVSALREEPATASSRVVIASYLLAPGYFHDRLHEAGAELVTAPLGPDPRLALIALDRYDAAVETAGGAFRPSAHARSSAEVDRQTSSLLDQRVGIQSA